MQGALGLHREAYKHIQSTRLIESVTVDDGIVDLHFSMISAALVYWLGGNGI